MPFTPGAQVVVLSINRRGEVESVVRPGTYRVRVGAMTTTARETELRPAAVKKAKGRAVGRGAAVPRRDDAASSVSSGSKGEGAQLAGASAALATLDLHGLTVDEARNKVAGHISRAILAGLDRVEIVHGIGTGRLKAAVTADLRQISAVRRVAPHPTNPGVVVVDL
jgi:dsDNA-specific endonuclease/ATPase MutS2